MRQGAPDECGPGPGHDSPGTREPFSCLGKREPSGEEGAPGDRRLAAELAECENVVERRDAAGCDHRERRSEDFREEVDVGPGERAVTQRCSSRGVARRPRPAHSSREARRRRLRRPRPAVHGHLAVAGVDRDDEALGEPLRCVGEERRRERGRSDHHAIGTGIERRRDRVDRAIAAADLERQAAGGGDPLDEIERGYSAERTVEVDEVEATRALVAEAPSELDRVAALDRDGLSPALGEPDDASFEDVDGRDDFEAACVNTLSCYHVVRWHAHSYPLRLPRGSSRTSVARRCRRGHRRARCRASHPPDEDEVTAFLRDLCTRAELEALAHRWQTARLVDEGVPYVEIAERVPTSTATVTRVAQWVRHGTGGYRIALDRVERR